MYRASRYRRPDGGWLRACQHTGASRARDLKTLWAIAGPGTIVAAIALVLLMWGWTRPFALAYAGIWAVLVGAYWTDFSPFLLLEAALPLASVAFALYGVWAYRSREAA